MKQALVIKLKKPVECRSRRHSFSQQNRVELWTSIAAAFIRIYSDILFWENVLLFLSFHSAYDPVVQAISQCCFPLPDNRCRASHHTSVGLIPAITGKFSCAPTPLQNLAAKAHVHVRWSLVSRVLLLHKTHPCGTALPLVINVSCVRILSFIISHRKILTFIYIFVFSIVSYDTLRLFHCHVGYDMLKSMWTNSRLSISIGFPV